MDNRRLILLLVFSFSLIMLWDAWQRQNRQSLRSALFRAGSRCASGVVPTPTYPANGAPAAGPAAGSRSGVARLPGAAKARVRTDLLVWRFPRRAATLHGSSWSAIPDTEDKSKNFVLFDNGGKHVYLAQSGVIGEGLPNHKMEWKLASGEHVLKDGEDKLELRLEATAAAGAKWPRPMFSVAAATRSRSGTRA
jgi:YidC/Oxa1 family membrane protein insertase